MDTVGATQVPVPAGNRSENDESASRSLKDRYWPLFFVLRLPATDNPCMASYAFLSHAGS